MEAWPTRTLQSHDYTAVHDRHSIHLVPNAYLLGVKVLLDVPPENRDVVVQGHHLIENN